MAIVSATLAKAPGPERDAFLKQACAADPELLAAVEAEIRSTLVVEPLASELESVQPVESVGSRIGSYKILQEIGQGGCGVVYLAEQDSPITRRVALKVIKLGMDSRQVIARFEAERQALARMNHPNIAAVLDAGTTQSGRPYFVMELVRGVPITRYCDDAKLTTATRLKLFVEVCKAIQHAHLKGIIHRDIKPSNILVALHDGEPVPKVIDFGIAKATEGKLTDKTLYTAFEQFIGTPAYMSPEQVDLSGLDIDTRSDIYSLGVLLYELLVGVPPFDPNALVQAGIEGVRRKVRDEDPPKPSTRLRLGVGTTVTTAATRRSVSPAELIRTVDGDLDWIVMKALEKERTRRYETASAMAQDIENYLNNEPVLARPPSHLYRIQKFARRNKLTFAAAVAMALAAGAVFVALTGGLALSTYLFLRERQARQMVAQAEQEAALTQAEVIAFGNPELIERVSRAREFQGQMARARDMIDRGRLDEASSLLNEILASSVKGGTVEIGALEMRSEVLARRASFAGAAADLTRLTEINPDDHWNWFVLSPLLIHLGEQTNYSDMRAEMLDRFGETDDALAAERVAKAASLRPLEGGQAVTLGRLLTTISAHIDQDQYADEFAQYRDAFRFCEALGHYRIGNYEQALEAAQPALNSSYPYFIPPAYAVVAMSQMKLNRAIEARQSLNTGQTIAQMRLPKIEQPDAGHLWNDILIAKILLDEAEQLLAPESKVNTQPGE